MALTAPPWGKLRRESSPDRVAAAIRRMIVDGALEPGVALRQRDVAREFGVSRIPVREAFVALEREGWITLGADNGAYVRGLSEDDIIDHYELRGIVLGLIARRAVERATPSDVSVLVERAAVMRRADDLASFSAANDRFLGRMLRMADSTRLRAALLVSPSILPEGFFDVVADGRAIQQRGVAAFLTALRKGSPEGADDAFRALLRRQGRAVRASLTTARPVAAGPSSTGVHDGAPSRLDGTPEQVVQHVKAAIFDGSLEADQRLPQDDIAAALGVSRIPIRQAIIVLERDGWLRVEPHRGAFVVALDERRIADHFELLGRFYGFGAVCAIDRASADDIEALSGLAHRLAGRTTAAAFESANREYLARLVDAAGSGRLRIVLGTSSALVPGSFFARVPGSIETQKAGIAVAQAALAEGDRDAARDAFESLERQQAANVVAMRSAGTRS